MELDELYNLAKKENLDIYFTKFNGLNGLFLENNIFLNKSILNTHIEKMVLAEELGHYFTGVIPTPPFSSEYYNKLLRSKNEFKAKKWVINNLIPFNKLNRFLSENYSKFDIAEELDVDASLIDYACKLYYPNK